MIETSNIADKTNIAVLPFVNMSASVENEYFSDGMTEEIINALAKIDGLKVTSRTSAFHFKGKNMPIPEIGKALGVSTLLEGSVRRSGNELRITAQLIDATDDFHFWSETWDRTLDNIFEVQDEISLLIAEKLREHIGHFEIEEPPEARPTQIGAYEWYLKSKSSFAKFHQADLFRAVEEIENAIAIDGRCPFYYASKAIYYAYLGDKTRTLEHLRQFSKEDNYYYWILLLPMDPVVDAIRDLPEYKEIMQGIETKFWNNNKAIRADLESKGLLPLDS